MSYPPPMPGGPNPDDNASEPGPPEPQFTLPSPPTFTPGSASVPSQPTGGYDQTPIEPTLVIPPEPPQAGPPPPAGPSPYAGPPQQPAPERPQPYAGPQHAYSAPPTESAPIVGAPGSGGPAYGAPGYGVPVLGTPYGEPTYPAYAGAPVGRLPPGAPAEPRRRRGGVVVLTILMVMFFLAAGAMGGLYIAKDGELQRTKKDLTSQVTDRDGRISTKDGEIDRLKKETQTAKDELADTKQKLTGTENAADELKRQKAVISKCLNLLGEASVLADQGKTTQARAKLAEAEPVCDEADRYLQ